jgi:hypothetical protein
MYSHTLLASKAASWHQKQQTSKVVVAMHGGLALHPELCIGLFATSERRYTVVPCIMRLRSQPLD